MSKKQNNITFDQVKLKFLTSINDDSLTEDTDPEFEIKYIDIGNVISSGEIIGVEDYQFGKAPSRARRKVKRGDIIISTVRTYLKAITSIDVNLKNLIVSTGFAVVRPKIGVLHPDYCKYALRESNFIDEVQRRSVGVSYPAINTSDLGDILISVPSYELQKKIGDFLELETKKIDNLISQKEKLISLLAEKRQALITKAVTRGIDAKVKLKDSGIDWLGKVPDHWEVERTRWLFQERNERSITGEEELLTVSHITGVTPRSEKDVNMFEAESNEGYKIALEGDLVINTLWAWMGAMGTTRTNGIVSPAYHVYKPQERLLPSYVDAIVRLPIFAKEVTRYSKGVWSSRLRLYPEGLYEVYFPVPPIEEQSKITNHIEEEISKINRTTSVAQKSIKLLKERRTALISAAVTGELDIPVS